MDNVWLVAFADSRLGKPRKRLMRQALDFGFRRDRIRILSEQDLSPEFRAEFADKLVLGSRGYGYWCWKPHICLETMAMMSDEDVLFYVDIGCHLNKKGKPRFQDYINLAKEKGFCAFQARSLLSISSKPDSRHHVYLNSSFAKGDLLDYFSVRKNFDILNAGQVVGTAFFIKKCDAGKMFLDEWMQVCRDDFALIDDSPSKSSNLPGFVAHRHDQSVFSILWLLKGYPTISGCEIEPLQKYAPAPKEFRHNPFWGRSWFWQMSHFPILAKRDKGLLKFHVKLVRFIWLRVLKRKAYW